MKLTVAELFAGVGGFRVGLNNIKGIDGNTGKAIENGDWEFVWANQFEPSTKVQHAYDCYCKRFPTGNHSNTDINLVNKENIPDHSLLVGGFPCQDYSVARSLSNERGIEGKKGVLFWDIKEVLISQNSPFVLLENVDRLLKSPASMRGRDFAVMLKTFSDMGYYVTWRVINSGDYGFPQKRKRVFIFAFKKNTNYASTICHYDDKSLLEHSIFNNIFPSNIKENTIQSVNLNDYEDVISVSNNFNHGMFYESGYMVEGIVYHSKIEPIAEKPFPLSKVIQLASEHNSSEMEKYIVDNEKLDKWKYLKGAKKIERTSKNGHSYIYSEGPMSFPENLDSPARTMLTSEGTLNRSSHIIFDDILNRYRILTEVECELIQMFPPNWTDTMPSRSRYFMMGNALVTGVIQRLEPQLKTIIEAE